ncbi:hypothetical protein PRIC2_003944 [Phytophthora ramorum]
MEEEQGVAAFKSFPGEGFRFSVGRVNGVGHIWLENQVSKQRWVCEVADVAAFAPTDVVLPQNTVLHYVAASLKESVASPDSANLGPNLVREDADETLQLEVLIKLGVADFAWTPKYVFPMTLLPQEPPPAEAQSSQLIKLLTAQVQELQQEVKALKEQMAVVLSAQAASQQIPTPSSPSQASTASSQSSESVPPSVGDTVENGLPVPKLSRKDQVWSDIIGHPCHQLVQTPEFRETRNSVGVVSHNSSYPFQENCKLHDPVFGLEVKAASLSRSAKSPSALSARAARA